MKNSVALVWPWESLCGNDIIANSMTGTVSLRNPRCWKTALLLTVFAFITSLPQLYLCYARGSEWNGSCAYLDTDELAYAAYTNALIDGRPRRNDPYTGIDNSQYESLYSIQFLPAYVVALPARLLHVSASTAFIVLLPSTTIAAALVILWFLFELTLNIKLATAGAVGVLCLGTVAALNPLQALLGAQSGYDLLPFLRRIVPAIPFPILIASCLFTWRALTRNPAWAVLAGLSFAILVYSYFFLWTAALAWFCTIILLWFIARGEDRKRVSQVAGIITVISMIALAPYAWLLMHRPPTLDRAQLLEITHAPDLFRAPEIYGFLILCGLGYYAKQKLRAFRDPKILFASSFALATFLVFNQQIITGHSLQSFHYEEFVTNYWIVLAFFLALDLTRHKVSSPILIYLTVGALTLAAVLGIRGTLRIKGLNIHVDEARAVALKFREENREGVVFASDLVLTHSFPATGRNPVLWAQHLYTFSNLDLIEQRTRFYQYLYYSGFDDKQLSKALHSDYSARWEVFGAERAGVTMLTISRGVVTEEEINNAAQEYAGFAAKFDRAVASNPILSYAVVSPDDNLSNLDRWYERGPAARTGGFVIYQLKLRPSS